MGSSSMLERFKAQEQKVQGIKAQRERALGRREELVKVIKKMAEDGKVSLRSARHVANGAIDKLEKDKKVSEDEKFNGHKDIQKFIDKYSEEIDKLLKVKEEEIVSH